MMSQNRSESVKSVLVRFLDEQTEAAQLRKAVFGAGGSDNPEPGSMWEMGNEYSWIFAEPINWHNLMAYDERSKTPAYFRLKARPIYDAWIEEGKGAAGIQGKKIPRPTANISIRNYLRDLAKDAAQSMHVRCAVEEELSEGSSSLKWRSLRGFLEYVKRNVSGDQQDILGGVFPRKWGVWCDEGKAKNGKVIALSDRCYVVRDVNEKDNPMSCQVASKTIQCLIHKILKGRNTGQRITSETLGFLWLCLSISFRGVGVTECSLLTTKLVDLKSSRGRRQTHAIIIQTLSGIRNIPISRVLYDFLVSLPRSPEEKNIFNKPLRSLLRTLASCFQSKMNRPTFRNFLQPPHW